MTINSIDKKFVNDTRTSDIQTAFNKTNSQFALGNKILKYLLPEKLTHSIRIL